MVDRITPNIWTDYPKIPLPQVLSFIVDNRGKTVPTTETGHKLIATNCIRNENLYPSYEKIRFLSDDTYRNWFRAHPVPGDIIFVCKGTPGRVCMVPDPIDFCIAQDMVALRANEDIVYNRYLLVILRSAEIQKQIYNYSVGDVIPHFKKSFFDRLEIPIPPMKIQRAIGDFYFSFSLKIELNTQINHNLEEQAKAIYATYFPYSVDDALPDDWRKGTLGEIIDLHDSKRIPLSGNERAKMEKIYPYYGAASLMDYVNDYLFDGVFLLLGEDGTVVTDNGLPVLQYVWGKFWVNNHAHILTGKAGFSVESLLLLLKQTPVKSIVTGAVQPKISQANLKSIQIVIPPEKLLQEFNSVITPLFALIRQNSEESKRLAQLRDALLPKLMSGEIDVSEVEI